MPAVRPKIPSTPEMELNISFGDQLSANDEKDFQTIDTKCRNWPDDMQITRNLPNGGFVI